MRRPKKRFHLCVPSGCCPRARARRFGRARGYTAAVLFGHQRLGDALFMHLVSHLFMQNGSAAKHSLEHDREHWSAAVTGFFTGVIFCACATDAMQRNTITANNLAMVAPDSMKMISPRHRFLNRRRDAGRAWSWRIGRSVQNRQDRNGDDHFALALFNAQRSNAITHMLAGSLASGLRMVGNLRRMKALSPLLFSADRAPISAAAERLNVRPSLGTMRRCLRRNAPDL